MELSSSSPSCSSSAASSSLVSKARTAFHSAAARAEKVFTDIKADLKPDRGFPTPNPNPLKLHFRFPIHVDLIVCCRSFGWMQRARGTPTGQRGSLRSTNRVPEAKT
ncbi:hypothetical protein ACLOJK_039386 [Asimina triloba]